ncbi:hypothetical protein CWO89_11555 [Bradyrhizobium sp. Leo170]|nr:hypothetical protein CWO89_11555 [Bradyrhizobium sp. Leo170]
MRSVMAIVLLAICCIGGPVAAEENIESRRAQARALAAAGKPAEALPIYDDLTLSGSLDSALYKEATQAAAAAHDMRRVPLYMERRVKADPSDYTTRSIIALAWRVAGDEAQAKRSREDYLAFWRASTDPRVRAIPFLAIDQFSAGDSTVYAYQCVEVAGDFGVGYMFEVYTPMGPPLPLTEAIKNHRQRIVLEHNKMTQKVLSELNKRDGPPVPTLDLLTPDRHATLQMFDGEPDYPMLRDIVAKYVANEQDLASKPPMGRAWNHIRCLTESK